MNTETGEFVELDRAEKWMEKLAIDEIVMIKGGYLTVVKIQGREVTLKLLSAEDRVLLVPQDIIREMTQTPKFGGKEKKQRDHKHGGRARR